MNTKILNYQEVPTELDQDLNIGKTEWKNGKYYSIDEGNYLTVFIGHYTETIDDKIVTFAYPIRVKKPFTIDKAITSATESSYLVSDMNSFSREILDLIQNDPNNKDLVDYNNFVEWVKNSLNGTWNSEVEVEKAKMLSKITEYDKSQSVNSFVLDGDSIWLDKSTRVGLMNSTQIEKAAGKEETTLWFGSKSYTIPIDSAIQMLSALELYALECYNVTAQHKADVESLSNLEEIKNYDYTSGYPEKLNLSTTQQTE